MDRVFSFLLWPKREARGPWKQGRKKRGSLTCPTDRANEAKKMFIIWLCWLFRFWKGDRELEVRTATYGPEIDQSQHAKSVSHIIIRGMYCILWALNGVWQLLSSEARQHIFSPVSRTCCVISRLSSKFWYGSVRFLRSIRLQQVVRTLVCRLAPVPQFRSWTSCSLS